MRAHKGINKAIAAGINKRPALSPSTSCTCRSRAGGERERTEESVWREETQNETRRFFAETFPFRTHFACTPQLCSAVLDTVFFVKREREREVRGGWRVVTHSSVEGRNFWQSIKYASPGWLGCLLSKSVKCGERNKS